MEQQEVLIRDKCISGLKQTQLVLNTVWLAAMITHLYIGIQQFPFSSQTWPLEFLLLITLLFHAMNITIVCCFGIPRLYSSFGCLFLQNLLLFLLVFVAYFLIRYLGSNALVPVMLDYSFCFIQSLLFLKCIYLRNKALRHAMETAPLSNLLLQLKVKVLPESSSISNACAICLDQMSSYSNKQLIGLQCSPLIKHYFHYDCFEKWFQKSIQCPICRGEDYLKYLKRVGKVAPHNEPDTQSPIMPTHIRGSPSTERLNFQI